MITLYLIKSIITIGEDVTILIKCKHDIDGVIIWLKESYTFENGTSNQTIIDTVVLDLQNKGYEAASTVTIIEQ